MLTFRMHQAVFLKSLAVGLMALWFAFPVQLFAQQGQVNDPRRINPIYRSWLYTQRGDSVLYSVLGEENHNEELWQAIGNQGEVYAYQITRRKDGQQVGERVIQRYTNAAAHGQVPLAAILERQGYFGQNETRELNGVQLPVLILNNPMLGRYVYSEDIPLGGVFSSVDYQTGRQMTLLSFQRAQSPAPSRIPGEVGSAGRDAAIGGIEQRGAREDSGRGAAPAAAVRDLGTVVREDADVVPPWFRTAGSVTNELDDMGWLLDLRTGVHMSIGRWEITIEDSSAPGEEPKASWEVRIQNEGPRMGGEVKGTLLVANVKGEPPNMLELLDKTDGHGISIRVPQSSPMMPDRRLSIYRERNETISVRGTSYQTVVYGMFEEPEVERSQLADGGEQQHVRRVLHRLWIDRVTHRAPLLIRRVTIEGEYTQKTNNLGRVIESGSRRITRTENLVFFRHDVPQETLASQSVPE